MKRMTEWFVGKVHLFTVTPISFACTQPSRTPKWGQWGSRPNKCRLWPGIRRGPWDKDFQSTDTWKKIQCFFLFPWTVQTWLRQSEPTSNSLNPPPTVWTHLQQSEPTSNSLNRPPTVWTHLQWSEPTSNSLNPLQTVWTYLQKSEPTSNSLNRPPTVWTHLQQSDPPPLIRTDLQQSEPTSNSLNPPPTVWTHLHWSEPTSNTLNPPPTVWTHFQQFEPTSKSLNPPSTVWTHLQQSEPTSNSLDPPQNIKSIITSFIKYKKDSKDGQKVRTDGAQHQKDMQAANGYIANYFCHQRRWKDLHIASNEQTFEWDKCTEVRNLE